MTIANLEDLEAASNSTDQITFKLASTREEREAAFRLVYQSYLQAGLTKENEHKMRITPYHLQPSTAIFVAKLRQEVVSTVSLVCDDELGLPIGQIYSEEVEQRRQAGIRIGEVTCLADRRKHLARRLTLLIGLFRLMVQYARNQDLDQIMIAVHPRHAAFYQRFLAFQKVGEERAYAAVMGNPAVALCLDFVQIDHDRPANYEKFFGSGLPDDQLMPQPMNPEDREYFSAILQDIESMKRRVG